MFDNLATDSLETNNILETSLETNNVFTSDELEANANYVDGETKYAREKRDPDKRIKILVLSLTTIFSGLSVTDLLFPKAKVEEATFSINSNNLTYSFSLSKSGIIETYLCLENNHYPFYKLKLEESKIYEGMITNINEATKISIVSTSILGNKVLYAKGAENE